MTWDRVTAGVLAVAMIACILWDAFEVIILPRRVTSTLRVTQILHRAMWTPWRAFACRIKSAAQRDAFLSIYGPISLIVLLALWAAGIIVSFAVVLWSLGAPMSDPHGPMTSASLVYASGVTFFTLGYGDVVPNTALARAIVVGEAGLGFGFLAIVIGYLPVIYQSFSRREVAVSTLDARAGSPPHAAELVRRLTRAESPEGVRDFLRQWEAWSAELLESHLSYPVLCYYRSQHDNQSWLAALTAILDTCALGIVGVPGLPAWQCRLTFAMTRHAVVDLADTLNVEPTVGAPDRLPDAERARLWDAVQPAAEGVPATRDDASAALAALRAMYEPYVHALASHLVLALPPWTGDVSPDENWHDERAPRPNPASPFVG